MQTGLLGAGHVERHVAVGLGALDAGPAPPPAHVARELPPGLGDLPDPVDGLQEDRVGKLDLRYPEGARHVRPLPLHRLLEGAALVGTEEAVHRPGRGLQAPPAQPLALRYVRDAVALLVDGQVAHVAEEDGVGVVALAVVAYAADGVLVNVVRVSGLAVLPHGAHLEEALLLQAVHEDLEGVLGDGREPLGLAVLVHQGEPLVVFLVHVVLHHLVQVFGGLLHKAVVGWVTGWGIRVVERRVEDCEVGDEAGDGGRGVVGGVGGGVVGGGWGLLGRASLAFVLGGGGFAALRGRRRLRLALGPALRRAEGGGRRGGGGSRRAWVERVFRGRFGGFFCRLFVALFLAQVHGVQVMVDLYAVVLVVEFHLHHALRLCPREIPPGPPPHYPGRPRGAARTDALTALVPAPRDPGGGADLPEVVHDAGQASVVFETGGAFEGNLVTPDALDDSGEVVFFVLHLSVRSQKQQNMVCELFLFYL